MSIHCFRLAASSEVASGEILQVKPCGIMIIITLWCKDLCWPHWWNWPEILLKLLRIPGPFLWNQEWSWTQDLQKNPEILMSVSKANVTILSWRSIWGNWLSCIAYILPFSLGCAVGSDTASNRKFFCSSEMEVRHVISLRGIGLQNLFANDFRCWRRRNGNCKMWEARGRAKHAAFS